MSKSRSYVPLTAAIVAALATTAPAHAQEELTETPRRRQGYYASFGYASGAAHSWDDGEALGAWPGSKAALRIGQLLTRRLGLGLSFEGGGSKKDQRTSSLFGIAVEGQVELISTLALRAQVGFGVLQIEDKASTDKTLRGTYGSQYGVGLSYDWFPGGSARSGGFSITPTLDVRVLPGDSAANVAGFIGVELSYWTGLPRNQLQLPESDAYR